MTVEEVQNSVFVFDAGEKRIGDCDREELFMIIGHQQETLLMAQKSLHSQQALLRMRTQ